KFPAHIEIIGITVTIHDAEARSLKLGQVSNAFVRIVDEETQNELLRFELGEDFSIETAVVVCEIYRHGGEWKFKAIG
ncbi:TerD family protein, partial [Bacillus vallismortis]|nr:TerD family protein [Bacillus vallismortis]